MRVWVDILIGVAASAVFFVIQPYLVTLPYPWNLLSAAFIFALSTGIAFLFDRSRNKGPAEVMSGNSVDRNMDAKIDGTDLTGSATVLSGNKVGGDASFEIKNTRL